MSEPSPRLALLTPHGLGADAAPGLAAAIGAACAAGDVAAIILRLAPSDPRSLVSLIKRLAPAGQEHGAAVLVACPGADDLTGLAARGGADGVHVDKPGEGALRDLRAALRDGRILGVGSLLESKHAAMAAGEAGADYLLFGGLYPDGVAPDPDHVRERATWWAEIFETPCIAVATKEQEVSGLAGTGAEFVGLESALWLDEPEAVARIQAQLRDRCAP